jgi:sugar phosphate isomerase/epimerase
MGTITRRVFTQGAAAAIGAAATSVSYAAPSNIRFGVASVAWDPSLEETIPKIAALGFQGIEPFRLAVQKYEANPAALKALLDAAGLTLITCSSHPATMSTDFLDPAKAPQTIKDHVEFATKFLRYFQCDHFKISLGPRRDDTPMTQEQLQQVASTLNEIGKRTIDIGIRIAPHPLIGSPMERESDVRTIMALTDPRYVWMTTDTGHLTLGGMDPLKIISDYFPRVAEVHLKDVEAKYRGWSGASYRDPRPYRTMGAEHGGGVNFVAIYQLLKRRGYNGWCALDIDGTDVDGDTSTIAAANAKYLTDVLHIRMTKRRA